MVSSSQWISIILRVFSLGGYNNRFIVICTCECHLKRE